MEDVSRALRSPTLTKALVTVALVKAREVERTQYGHQDIFLNHYFTSKDLHTYLSQEGHHFTTRQVRDRLDNWCKLGFLKLCLRLKTYSLVRHSYVDDIVAAF